MNSRKINKTNIIIILSFFTASIVIRLYNLDYIPEMYDEGNYLYISKLISQGHLPYKDFAIAHPPLYLYFIAFLWKTGFNRIGIRIINIILTSLLVVFAYLTTYHITKKKLPAILASLFLVCSPILIFHTRIVILDPIMTLFLLAGIYFYFFKENHKLKILSGILFALAVLTKFTAVILLITLFCISLWMEKDKRIFLKKLKPTLISFCLLVIPALSLLALIPGFVKNVLLFQATRSYIPWIIRVIQIKYFLSTDILIFALGILGTIIIFIFSKNKKLRIVSLSSLFALIASIFCFKTFFQHYAIQSIPGLCIAGSIGLYWLSQKIFTKKILIAAVVILLIYGSFSLSSEYRREVEDEKEVTKVIEILRSTPGYLYTTTPSFALASGKEIYPWYYATESDKAFELRTPYTQYNKIIGKCETVLLDIRAKYQLPEETKIFIYSNFKLLYKTKNYEILTKS